MSETTPKTTVHKLSGIVNMPYGSLQPILAKKRKVSVFPLRFDTWMKCVTHFKKDPAVALWQLLEKTAELDGDMELAADYRAVWDNQQVKDSIVVLAQAYLDTRTRASKVVRYTG